MNISEMHEYFDQLLDKAGTSYFVDEERDRFINMAQLEYVKRALPSSEGGIVNVEYNQLVANNLLPLMYQTGAVTMNGSGVVTVAAAQSALDTVTDSTEPFIYVLNVSLSSGGSTYPVRYTRHNDWYEFENNRFKRASVTSPRYKYDAVNFTFAPADTSASVYFTFLKHPHDVNRNQAIDCELPEHTHKQIVELAANLAMVSLGMAQPQRDAESAR